MTSLFIDRYALINDLVLKAKLGDRDNFKKLWYMFQPLVRSCISRFVSVCPNLKSYRQDIHNDCYLYMWDIVNEFDFEGDYYFSYYLKRELCKKILEKSKRLYVLPNEVDLTEETVIERIIEDDLEMVETLRGLRYAMKQLSFKQLQAIHMYHYRGLTQQQSAEILGISQVGFRKRIVQSYQKIRKIMKKMQ